jgi:hypothetical protein
VFFQLRKLFLLLLWGATVGTVTLPSLGFAAPRSPAQETIKYREPLIISERIIASASTLSGEAANKTESDFLSYAVEVRRSYAYGREPSSALLRLRDSLKRNPGLIFDFLVKWEQQAQDCTGTATAALFATFAELTPSYGALRQWIDVRLMSIVQASDTRAAFRFIRCAEDPKFISQSDADLLISIFLGIKYQLEATGSGAPFTVRSEKVLAKISQPGLRAAMARLADKVRPATVVK